MDSKRVLTEEENRTWIEDGIVYAEYNKSSGVDDVISLLNECMTKVAAAKIGVAPIIVHFTPKGNLAKVSVMKLGKMINTELVKHISTVYLVGAHNIGNPAMISLGSRVFLNNRVRVCKDVAEAKQLAAQNRSSDFSILEQ